MVRATGAELHPEVVRRPERIHPASDQIRLPALHQIRAVGRIPDALLVPRRARPAPGIHLVPSASGVWGAGRPGIPVPGLPACAGSPAHRDHRRACGRKWDGRAVRPARPGPFPARPLRRPPPRAPYIQAAVRFAALPRGAEAVQGRRAVPAARLPPAWPRQEQPPLELSLPQPLPGLRSSFRERLPAPERRAQVWQIPQPAEVPAQLEPEPQEPPQLPPAEPKEAGSEWEEQPERIRLAPQQRLPQQGPQAPGPAIGPAQPPPA